VRDDVATVAAYDVDLGEVADALRGHPAVALASAYGVPDPEMGMHVRAVVTLAPHSEASVAALVDFLRDRLCYYKIPQSFRFRRLDRPA
jgi:fatty-acyl-CoA synthase